MILKNQERPLEELERLAKSKCHSLLISGSPGCGKSYLAKEYSKMLGLNDFNIVGNSVQEIRDMINTSYDLENDQVICIENLDCGLSAASYTILKFLEEPLPHTYIVVTCRNINRVPDTILSRSAVVSVGAPTHSDIQQFAKLKDGYKFDLLSNQKIWKAVSSFGDVSLVYNMTPTQINYISELGKITKFTQPVSEMCWALSKYSDNTDTPIVFVLQYLLTFELPTTVKKACIECMNKLLQRTGLPAHLVLTRFLFEAKYVE